MAVNFVPDTIQGSTAVALPPAARVGAAQRINLGTYETLATMAANDVLVLAKLPAHATLLEFSVGHDDLDAGGAPTLAFDYGICDKDGNNVAVSGTDSRERLVNAVVETGVVALTDRRFAGLTPANVANMDDALWELAGMTANAGRPLFLCVRTSTAAQTWANGTFFWRIRFGDN
jgi:hypothetical protein